METLTILLIIAVAALALFSLAAYNKMKTATEKASAEASSRQSLESKLTEIRKELSGLKEDHQRKSKSLEEARENAKKRLRKDAQKSDTDSAEESSSDSETDRLKRALAAMESQLRTIKESSEQAFHAAKASLEASHSKELDRHNDEIERLQEQVSQAKGETTRRRQGLSKQLATPTPVDLTTLPSEVVSELSRLLRKNEQHEKMHGILQGKHQLAQERYQELQRRYFAVCRELALVALPAVETSDDDARRLAESVVEASDSLSLSKEKHEAVKVESAGKTANSAES